MKAVLLRHHGGALAQLHLNLKNQRVLQNGRWGFHQTCQKGSRQTVPAHSGTDATDLRQANVVKTAAQKQKATCSEKNCCVCALGDAAFFAVHTWLGHCSSSSDKNTCMPSIMFKVVM